MCGTEYVVTADSHIFLQQREVTECVDTVSITNKRMRDPDGELTSHQLAQLRAGAGSEQWLATQTRVDLAARGATTGPNVQDLPLANGLIRAARAGAHHYLRSVPVDWNALLNGAFHDPAWANRTDGSSPGGEGGSLDLLRQQHCDRKKEAPVCLAHWRSWTAEEILSEQSCRRGTVTF